MMISGLCLGLVLVVVVVVIVIILKRPDLPW
jgi:hypothetical protein